MLCTAGLSNRISIVLSRATAPQLRLRRDRQTRHSASKAASAFTLKQETPFSVQAMLR